VKGKFSLHGNFYLSLYRIIFSGKRATRLVFAKKQTFLQKKLLGKVYSSEQPFRPFKPEALRR